MPTYPAPVYSHLNATDTGPGAVIDIGVADDDGYPPVLILKMEGTVPVTTEFVIDGLVTEIRCQSAISWADVWSNPVGDSTVDVQGVVSSTKTTEDFPPPDFVWSLTRSIMQFDTSVLSGLTVLSVSMELFIREGADLRDVTVHIVDKGTVADSWPFPATDRDDVGTISYGSRNFVTGESDEQWAFIALSPAAAASLNLTGNSIFCARTDYDLDNIDPLPAEPEGQAVHRLFWFQNDESTCCRIRVIATT